LKNLTRKERRINLSKLNSLSIIIQELRDTASNLSKLADDLEHEFSSKPVEKKVSLEDVRAVLAEKSRNGLTKEVRELLLNFGVNKLSEVDPKDYPAILSEAERLTNAK
jgi:hypothetical protein